MRVRSPSLPLSAAASTGLVGYAAFVLGAFAAAPMVACSSGGAAAGGAPPCAATALTDDAGACHDVGVAACAPAFVDDDGVCRPSASKCPAGQIPKFDEGCVATGIPNCAPEFMESDGLCHPKLSKCAAGTFAVPQAGCVSIDGDSGCGAGPWGFIPDQAFTVYVDASYAGGGSDGSKAAPMTTLAAGLAKARAGGRVALAAGTYAGPAVIDKPLEIVGRCASMVTIDGDDGDAAAPTIIHVTAGPSIVRGVRLTGDGAGVYVDGATAAVDHVFADKPRIAGVYADQGANVTVTRTFVQGSRSFDPFRNTNGDGFDADRGATLTLVDSAVSDTAFSGVHASNDGTHLSMNDVLQESGGYAGVLVEYGPTADLAAIAVVHNQDSAVSLEEATVRIRDFLIDDTYGQGFFDGEAIYATDAAPITLPGQPHITPRPLDITLTRGAFTKTHGPAVYASDPGTTLTASALLATDGVGGEPQFLLLAGASATLTDSAFLRGRVAGLAAVDYGGGKGKPTKLTAKRVLIEDVGHINRDGDDGEGILASGVHVAVDLDAVVVTRAHVAAVLGNTTGTVRVSGSLFSHTQAGNGVLDGKVLQGIADGVTAKGAAITLVGVRVEGCSRAGILLDTCSGSVEAAVSTDNQFGAVLEGTTAPTVDGVSDFVGNTKGALVNDGHLPVPSGPPVMPM